MVIMSDPAMPSEAALVNIRNARKYFEELENPNSISHPFQWYAIIAGELVIYPYFGTHIYNFVTDLIVNGQIIYKY